MKVNIDLTKTNVNNVILNENKYSVGTIAFFLDHDFFYGGADVEIWTNINKLGTKLTEGVDYTLGSLRDDLTVRAGVDIFGSVTIINVDYQTGNLYFNYHACADIIDAYEVALASRYPSDGRTWSLRSPAQSNFWSGLAYGGGVAIATSLTGTNRVMRSTDKGENWSTVTATSSDWRSVAYGNEVFVAVSAQSSPTVMKSSNLGLTWSTIDIAPIVITDPTSIAYGDGYFVIIASYLGLGDSMWSDDDGDTWTAGGAFPESGFFTQGLAFGDGVFIAISDDATNKVIRSTNHGISWSSVVYDFLGTPSSIAYGNGVFIITLRAAGNNIRAFWSDDNGLTWNGVAIGSNSWNTITYGNDKFVALAKDDFTNNVATSVDGQSWNLSAMTPVIKSWSNIIYADGSFIALTNASNTNSLIISPEAELITSSSDLAIGAPVTIGAKTNLLGNVVLPTEQPLYPVNGTIWFDDVTGGASNIRIYNESAGTWGWITLTFV